MTHVRAPLIATLLLAIACGTAKPGGMSGPTLGRMTEPDASPLESNDILRRTKTFQPVAVKHILIGWSDLEDNYSGNMDERAKQRSRFDAEDLVRRLEKRLATGEPIEPLMIEHSGDAGTKDGIALTVTPDSNFVPRFIALSSRLQVGEHGVVKTNFGYHLIKRVK